MAFIIPREIGTFIYAVDSAWKSIDAFNDVSPSATTVILQYGFEYLASGNIKIEVRKDSNSPSFILIETDVNGEVEPSYLGGQGFVPIDKITKGFQYRISGSGQLVGSGLTLTIVGEVKSCPDRDALTPGFGPEATSNEFINALNGLLQYRVPNGTVLTGVYSTYDPATGDRRWKTYYRPVTLPAGGTFAETEITTIFENSYQGILNYRVPDQCAVTGIYSEYDANRRDRRWKIRYRKINVDQDNIVWGIEKVSDFLNLVQGDLDFHAKSGEVITGFYSEWDNQSGDRRWKIRTKQVSFVVS